MAPKYEELAALYFNNPEYSGKVIVAKVDATANDGKSIESSPGYFGQSLTKLSSSR